ncbi:hypothetical protein QRX60_18580 [Amycolatopsis mongoliensis]|uniref:Uncharacterized protein n=1 Tax=Amycolatopsis mongoliensis TaxID=715475 RepID=A0A9Y2JZC4_9PSEU|nr:hypothetical protein [Amycolatopsis sp. 4-36]WIY05749.1 hypothetical protein QRX60_18580 [Amycolatopsis sp. 4-36]
MILPGGGQRGCHPHPGDDLATVGTSVPARPGQGSLLTAECAAPVTNSRARPAVCMHEHLTKSFLFNEGIGDGQAGKTG